MGAVRLLERPSWLIAEPATTTRAAAGSLGPVSASRCLQPANMQASVPWVQGRLSGQLAQC